MFRTTANRVARVGPAARIAVVPVFGLSSTPHPQVDPYPTVTVEDPSVQDETATNDPTETTVQVTMVEDADLARTGSDSGKAALLGLAALGAGGVCVSAARKRSTQS